MIASIKKLLKEKERRDPWLVLLLIKWANIISRGFRVCVEHQLQIFFDCSKKNLQFLLILHSNEQND